MDSRTESRVAACVECCLRSSDFSEKRLFRCELCGRWFCEKHLRPRTFLIRGFDVQDEELQEGIAFDDVAVEASPEQSSFILGTAPSWIMDRAREIKDEFSYGGRKERQWKRQGSHPDFEYTNKMLEELNIQGERRSRLTKRAHNRTKRYYSPERLQAINAGHSEKKPVTEKHFPTKDVAFLVVLLALAIVLWYVSDRY